MNTLVTEPVALPLAAVQTAINAACTRIAPTWPLDRFIAVNPYWGQLERPIAAAAAQLAGLSGSPMLMPRRWYAERFQTGKIGRQHLQAAITTAGAQISVDELINGLGTEPARPARLPLAKNCRFVASAAAAQQNGFRPCLRCRPECAPPSPRAPG